MRQVNEAEDFLELVINWHLIAAAMHWFSINTTSDESHTHLTFLRLNDTTIKRCRVFERLGEIMDGYIQFSDERRQPNPNLVLSSAKNPHVTCISAKYQ